MSEEDTYKGESPGKKWARYTFWKKVAQDVVGVDDFYSDRSRFLVLASREGGDVSVLRGVAVKPERIVAVDRCAEAAQMCREKYPDVRVETGDIADVIEANPSFTVAFLDFCGHLSPQLITTVARVMRVAPLLSVVAVAYLRGREKRAAASSAIVALPNQQYRRAARSKFGILKSETELLSGKCTDIRNVISEASHLDGDMARAVSLESILRVSCAPRFPVLCGSLQYHSRGRHSHGVPMEIAVLLVLDMRIGERELRSRLRSMKPFAIRCAATEDDIRRAVVAGRFDPNADLCLNIPRNTIAAWRAHATRGTYAKESA